MIEKDTIKLLRECDFGTKMGIAAIEDVLDRVQQEALRAELSRCMQEHRQLQERIRQRLQRFQDKGKDPGPMVTSMGHLKTALRLTLQPQDSTVASLMTDGCNMGIKSLNRYLNQYEAAEEYAKDIAKKLICLEQQLNQNLQPYL